MGLCLYMAKNAENESPLMRQHAEMKRKFPDAMLLFRVGDFYETFGEDARKASNILGITLTRKASGGGGFTDLAGIPHHAIDQYLPRLVKAGLRVAICEQLEDPKTVKGLVKRGITELVTPGVSYNDMVLEVKVWKWMYEHPQASAAQLKEAVITIAKDVWNEYYAPVFKIQDEPILAIYSHMIVDPLYLSAYPIGHIIDFQLESYLKDKNMGAEVARIYKIGRVHPDLWMQRAVGAPLSVQPLLNSTSEAVKNVRSKDKK